MKNDPKTIDSKVGMKAHAAGPAIKLAVDPIEVAKRKLDEARADYKRIKEINAGPKTEKTFSPERAAIKQKLSDLKANRLAASNEIKTTKAVIVEKRKTIKLMNQEKKDLLAQVKKAPRTVKSQAVKEARIAVLEAELAYRKACIG
jgi:hypothetical protein